jgi:hypothetical protein
MVRSLLVTLGILALGFGTYSYVARTPIPESYTYGASFNTPYARELGVPWESVYRAMLDELGVRHLRLAAHWPMVEPDPGIWNFTELDLQMQLAEEKGASVVLAVGRRLPRWPECHIPAWAADLPWEEQKDEVRDLVREVVLRYKDSPALYLWQVENEPFLTVYAHEQCGDFDKAFLDEELALVRSLDPDTPVLVTDSGNLGLWQGPYRRSDVFGTSVYLYLWNENTGVFKSFLSPQFYRFKQGIMGLLFGSKETLLIELSAEPWLNKPVAEADLELQLERMNVEKFNEIITYAQETHFEKQYLWGAEWWYWLRLQGEPGMWDRAKDLYQNGQ